MAYTPKERLTYVEMYLAGKPLKRIERDYGFDRKELAYWAQRYKKYGIAGLQHKNRFRSTFELRKQIVSEHLEKGITYAELCDRYDISRSTLKKWVSIARSEEYEAL